MYNNGIESETGMFGIRNIKKETTYTIYNKVTKIAQNAFYGNQKLKTVNFPAGLVEIEAGAFQNTVLTSVHFPASLQTVGEDAFVGCENIATVTCDAEVPPTGVMFDNVVYENATLNIPEGTEEAYKAAPGWSQFFGIVPTAVKDLNTLSDDVNAPAFNLQGQRVDANAKGIIIKNGKKILVK